MINIASGILLGLVLLNCFPIDMEIERPTLEVGDDGLDVENDDEEEVPSEQDTDDGDNKGYPTIWTFNRRNKTPTSSSMSWKKIRYLYRHHQGDNFKVFFPSLEVHVTITNDGNKLDENYKLYHQHRDIGFGMSSL